MKIRDGFVSNSSSSSFIISKKQLSSIKISMIINHIDVCQSFDEWKVYDYTDSYDISEKNNFIEGYTTMDNFPMYEFLEKIVGVDMGYVHWLDEWVPRSYDDIIKKDKKTTKKRRKV